MGVIHNFIFSNNLSKNLNYFHDYSNFANSFLYFIVLYNFAIIYMQFNSIVHSEPKAIMNFANINFKSMADKNFKSMVDMNLKSMVGKNSK
jgi:hypothetical protein